MKWNILDSITRQFEVELPYQETLVDYLDMILPIVEDWSGSLTDTADIEGFPWQEIRDKDNFYDKTVHFFLPEQKYWRSNNGEVEVGKWEVIPDSEKLVIEMLDKNEKLPIKREMYQLSFLFAPFFILQRDGTEDYLTLCLESEKARLKLEWRDYIDYLYYSFRKQNDWLIYIGLVLFIIIALIIVFSIF